MNFNKNEIKPLKQSYTIFSFILVLILVSTIALVSYTVTDVYSTCLNFIIILAVLNIFEIRILLLKGTDESFNIAFNSIYNLFIKSLSLMLLSASSFILCILLIIALGNTYRHYFFAVDFLIILITIYMFTKLETIVRTQTQFSLLKSNCITNSISLIYSYGISMFIIIVFRIIDSNLEDYLWYSNGNEHLITAILQIAILTAFNICNLKRFNDITFTLASVWIQLISYLSNFEYQIDHSYIYNTAINPVVYIPFAASLLYQIYLTWFVFDSFEDVKEDEYNIQQ